MKLFKFLTPGEPKLDSSSQRILELSGIKTVDNKMSESNSSPFLHNAVEKIVALHNSGEATAPKIRDIMRDVVAVTGTAGQEKVNRRVQELLKNKNEGSLLPPNALNETLLDAYKNVLSKYAFIPPKSADSPIIYWNPGIKYQVRLDLDPNTGEYTASCFYGDKTNYERPGIRRPLKHPIHVASNPFDLEKFLRHITKNIRSLNKIQENKENSEFQVHPLKDGSITVTKGAWVLVRLFKNGNLMIIDKDAPGDWIRDAEVIAREKLKLRENKKMKPSTKYPEEVNQAEAALRSAVVQGRDKKEVDELRKNRDELARKHGINL